MKAFLFTAILFQCNTTNEINIILNIPEESVVNKEIEVTVVNPNNYSIYYCVTLQGFLDNKWQEVDSDVFVEDSRLPLIYLLESNQKKFNIYNIKDAKFYKLPKNTKYRFVAKYGDSVKTYTYECNSKSFYIK